MSNFLREKLVSMPDQPFCSLAPSFHPGSTRSLPLDIERMLEQVLVLLVRVGQFSAGWVSVREGDTFSILTTTELPPELTQEDLSEMQESLYHCQNLAQMGSLKSGVEIIDCDRLEHRPEISLKRLITIPITVDGGQIFALMNLAYEETRLFNENTLRIYSEVGEMLSALIQKWMHHARALSSFHELYSFHESYKILYFLLDLSRKLFQIRSVERLLEVVSEALKDYFQLDQPVPVRFNRKPGAKEHYLVFDLPPSVRSEQTMMISLVSELTDQAVKLIQLLEKEKNFAERDSLTGLPNRLALEQRASLLLGAQPKLIIMFNIHRLTYINEQYGRDIGDMVIAIVAERLGKLFPGEGQLFKVAGDEFLAVLDDATLDNGALEYVALDHAALEDSHLEQDAFDHITLNRGAYEGSAQGMSGAKEETKNSLRSKRLEAIHQALHVPVELPDRVLSVQVDIGVALYPEHGADLFDLWRKANLALLKARMHHKRYQLFYPGVETSFLRDLSLKSSLRIAVQHGDFTLVFQPIYDLASERIVAAEVLLRWDEAAPDVLIPLAEELGLMAEIDHFVLTQANTISKMLPVPLAVNLSPTTVAHKKDAGHILSLADPQRITLEVTEHAVTNAAAVKNLRRLQKAGFKIALDDFGKGYSHLALLPELPLTALKLDRFFVQHIHEPRYRIILESIVAIAKHEAYRLELVAEGIEDRASLNFLRSLNIDRVQGYALSRPLPLEDLQKKLHRGDNSFYNDRKLHG